MRTMNVFAMVAVVFTMMGCVSGSVSEGACDTRAFSFDLPVFPTLPPSTPAGWTYTLPAVSAPPQSVDFSTTLSKITDVVDSLTAQITSLTLSNENGSLDWVKQVNVYAEGSTSDFPKALLATYKSSRTPGSTLNVSVVMDSTAILNYLSAGPVELTVEFPSTTVDAKTLMQLQSLHGTVSTNIDTCVAISGSASKSL